MITRSETWELFGEAFTHDWGWMDDRETVLAKWQEARAHTLELHDYTEALSLKVSELTVRVKELERHGFCSHCHCDLEHDIYCGSCREGIEETPI